MGENILLSSEDLDKASFGFYFHLIFLIETSLTANNVMYYFYCGRQTMMG